MAGRSADPDSSRGADGHEDGDAGENDRYYKLGSDVYFIGSRRSRLTQEKREDDLLSYSQFFPDPPGFISRLSAGRQPTG